MTRRKSRTYVLVTIAGLLVLGVGGLTFRGLFDPAPDPDWGLHPGEPPLESAHHKKGEKAIAAPVVSVTIPPDPPQQKHEITSALDQLVKNVDLGSVWDEKKQARAYKLREDEGDRYLQWLYLAELLRLQGKSNVRPEVMQQTQESLAEVRNRIAEQRPDRRRYFQAYTQWYELVCLSLDSTPLDWKAGGAASEKVNEVLALMKDAEWGQTGRPDRVFRYRLDGSVLSAMLYSLLTMYYYNERPGNSHAVGERLGIPYGKAPGQNPRSYEKREMVVLLKKAVALIDECYPEGVRPNSLGLRYWYEGKDNPDLKSLVGGKVLYYNAKAVLAFQNQQHEEMKRHLDDAYTVLLGLEKEKFALGDTYDYVYVMRSAALLIRMHVSRGENDRVGSLIRLSSELLRHPPSNQHYSRFYLPLVYLQFRNELREAKEDPALK